MTESSFLALGAVLLVCSTGLAQDGAELFRNDCSTRHRSGSKTQAPSPETLRLLPSQAIVAAPETGKMRSQGSQLSAIQRNVVAKYLGTSEKSHPAFCNLFGIHKASQSCSYLERMVCRKPPALNAGMQRGATKPGECNSRGCVCRLSGWTSAGL
jgi:hypothetical protein